MLGGHRAAKKLPVDVSSSSDHSLVFTLVSPHQITWLRVDEDVPPHAVVTGSNLYIENLNKSYNGTYRCVASNTVGEAYDDYILYVHGRCRAALGHRCFYVQSEFECMFFLHPA